jgi:hypothetical protein
LIKDFGPVVKNSKGKKGPRTKKKAKALQAKKNAERFGSFKTERKFFADE